MLLAERNGMAKKSSHVEPVDVPNCIQFVALDGPMNVRLKKYGNPGSVYTPKLVYSVDAGQSWQTYQNDTDIYVRHTGESVCFKAAPGVTNVFFESDYSHYTFDVDSYADLRGEAVRVYNENGLSSQKAGGFRFYSSLFESPTSQLNTISKFVVSCDSDVGVQYTNAAMFRGLSSLVDASGVELVSLSKFAGTGRGQYTSMFENCVNLSAGPKELDFGNRKAAQQEFWKAFQNCTQLVKAPYVKCYKTQTDCFWQLFNNCNNLNELSTELTSFIYVTNSWLGNVMSNGTFYCPLALGTNSTISRGPSACPTNWNVVNTDVLHFTAEAANSTVRLDKSSSALSSASLETSYNGITWSDYNWNETTGDTLTLDNVGDTVYMRAKTENTTFSESSSNYFKFVMAGRIAAGGTIMTLLKADGSRTDAPRYCFYNLFNDCRSLTQAPSLPATTLASYCYYQMFNNCRSLAFAPRMAPTTLNTACCRGMFGDCWNLSSIDNVTLPALTATTNCYRSLFSNCRMLTTVGNLELPAQTLASYCYQSMFWQCSSLIDAPALPATALDTDCYKTMFYHCSSLTSMDVSFESWSTNYTTNWLDGVSESGTFICNSTLPDQRGASYIPNGWTKVDK